MKATLSFNLPEESEDYRLHKNGPAFHSIIFNILQEFCRKKTKYESDQYSEEYLKAVHELKDFIVKELHEENVAGEF